MPYAVSLEVDAGRVWRQLRGSRVWRRCRGGSRCCCSCGCKCRGRCVRGLSRCRRGRCVRGGDAVACGAVDVGIGTPLSAVGAAVSASLDGEPVGRSAREPGYVVRLRRSRQITDSRPIADWRSGLVCKVVLLNTAPQLPGEPHAVRAGGRCGEARWRRWGWQRVWRWCWCWSRC